MRRHRLVYLVQSLILILILSFAGFLIYLAVVSGVYIFVLSIHSRLEFYVTGIRDAFNIATTDAIIMIVYRLTARF